MENKIYIVKYYGGSYEDYYERTIFATFSKSKAQKYRARFNRILKKWKKYYSQYESVRLGSISWLGDENIKYYKRWSSLRDYTECYIKEIEIR